MAQWDKTISEEVLLFFVIHIIFTIPLMILIKLLYYESKGSLKESVPSEMNSTYLA